jgi:hypothetical protein
LLKTRLGIVASAGFFISAWWVVVNSSWFTCSAQKIASFFLELILAHQARQKRWPKLGVGLWPNTAAEFKRGDFLEVLNKQIH